MSSENERVFIHAQKYPFRFQSTPYAAKKNMELVRDNLL